MGFEQLEVEVPMGFRGEGPGSMKDASLRTKLVEVIEFQLSYFKS